MEIKDFNAVWAISWSRGRPVYVSTSKLLVAHDFFTQSIPVTGGPATCYLDPNLSVSKLCALPELGRVAQTSRFSGNHVLVDQYPRMSASKGLTDLQAEKIEDCLAMSFIGSQLLLMAEFKPTGYRFELWRWEHETLADIVDTPKFGSEVPGPTVHVHPLRWYQAAVLSTARVIVLEVQEGDVLDLSYYYIEDEEGKLTLRRGFDPKLGKSCSDPKLGKNCSDPKLGKSCAAAEQEPPAAYLKLECFCWSPENRMTIATSAGIFEASLGDGSLVKLKDHGAAVAFLVRKGPTLYAAFETGVVEVVSTDRGQWDIVQAVRVDGRSVAHACLSPDWRYLTVSTGKSKVVNLELRGDRLERVGKTPERRIEEIVDVGVLDPLLPHCVVAERSGALHIVDETSGAVISTIHVRERLSSMATNPQCACVALGSSSGFLHFVDCTTPAKPRIVFCERPFESPIQRLRFDNFGRFVLASADTRVVIASAAPTSGFVKLGTLALPFAIQDTAALCRTAAGGTSVFVLVENDAGNGVLFKVQLPGDFLSSYKQYHKDSFGALSEHALGVQSLDLGRAFSRMEVHCELGLLLHSNSCTPVQRLDPWTDMENAELEDLPTLKGVHSLCLSLNQDLVATAKRNELSQEGITTAQESIELYSTALLTRRENPPSLSIFADWKRGSYLKFPVFGKNLICGKKNGDILYCEWSHKQPRPLSLPEWTVHCFYRTEAENLHLQAMEEDEPVDVIAAKEETGPHSERFKGRELNLLEACVAVTDFKLDQLDDQESIDEHLKEFLENMDIVSKLLLFNRKKIFNAMCRDLPDDFKVGTDKWLAADTQTVSSLNARVLVAAYSKSIIEKDTDLADSLDGKISKNGGGSEERRLSLSDVVKSRCKDDGLSAIKSLIRSICCSKRAFNAEFDALKEERQEVSDCVDQSYMEAKAMSQALPSKAERDFWNASVERSNVLLDTEADSKDGDSPQGSGPIADAKRSIDDHLRSSYAVQKTFDSSVNDLQRLRRLTDFSILGSEIKIYVILLFSAIEEELTERRKLLESSEKALGASMMELRSAKEDLKRLGGEMQDTFGELLRSERHASKKLEDKCSKMNLGQQALDQFKDQIEQGLDRFVRDQISSQSLSIDPDSIPLELEDFNERVQCLGAVPNAVSEDFRNRLACLLTLNFLWWNVRCQLLFVAETKETVHDFGQRLQRALKEAVQALDLLTVLQSKFCAKIQSVLALLKESSSVGEASEAMTLKALPAQDHEMWRDVDSKTLGMLSAKQTLNEIEGLFCRIKDTSKQICAKGRCLESEHKKFMEKLGKRLEEAKQAYGVANAVREEYVENRKRSAFNFLKSAFK